MLSGSHICTDLVHLGDRLQTGNQGVVGVILAYFYSKELDGHYDLGGETLVISLLSD